MQKVLIVDDSRVARMALRRLMAQVAPGAEVVEAGSVDEALGVADGIDVALIDYNMPGRDGLELAAELGARDPRIRRVLVTANVQDSLAERARGMGVGFVGKPTRLEDLKAAVLEPAP